MGLGEPWGLASRLVIMHKHVRTKGVGAVALPGDDERARGIQVYGLKYWHTCVRQVCAEESLVTPKDGTQDRDHHHVIPASNREHNAKIVYMPANGIFEGTQNICQSLRGAYDLYLTRDDKRVANSSMSSFGIGAWRTRSAWRDNRKPPTWRQTQGVGGSATIPA
ncbi:hypothetical protein BV25DRAFT_1899578 [Artomyces pyxidatus]|uniref:Uncharacterized protein n=1 Tax=Artomyces pyxidatus TaxID=48021 RepID=A0ACB8T2Z6_9AGAM|nr:hypothetical protein BV25DRAFT_1899578 [Artomyces pyxidatus]